ncbi:MAG: 50S ribosomal protein L22 [Propionibacteriaceae bacterium]|nr:50S ribosomal protein L22 [Propionibacteriaceae bacterium]
MRDPEKISARRRALLGDRAGSFAETKYLRMSASKMRRVIDLVRGKDANTALAILKFAPQAAAVPAYKTLASAVANAEQQEGLEADNLYISAIFADEGVTLRRIRARAKGSASRILKRGAHLTVVVEPKPEPVVKQSKKAADTAAQKTKTSKAKAAEPAESTKED